MENYKSVNRSFSLLNVVRLCILKRVNGYRTIKKNVSLVVSGDMSEVSFVYSMIARFLRGFVRDGLASVILCILLDVPLWYVLIYALIRVTMYACFISRIFLDEIIKK